MPLCVALSPDADGRQPRFGLNEEKPAGFVHGLVKVCQPVLASVADRLVAGPVPPEWGRLAPETLGNHFFYEFPGLGHGIMRSDVCGLEGGLQFIDDHTAEPDVSCIDQLAGPDFK